MTKMSTESKIMAIVIHPFSLFSFRMIAVANMTEPSRKARNDRDTMGFERIIRNDRNTMVFKRIIFFSSQYRSEYVHETTATKCETNMSAERYNNTTVTSDAFSAKPININEVKNMMVPRRKAFEYLRRTLRMFAYSEDSFVTRSSSALSFEHSFFTCVTSSLDFLSSLVVNLKVSFEGVQSCCPPKLSTDSKTTFELISTFMSASSHGSGCT
mmetsp:Transcript_28980/g.46878  ORF Transcript_28980/g.46878 Transcript_28980/m.46878 type:complete len:213 (-) Transcript_28980:1205-1843(-)